MRGGSGSAAVWEHPIKKPFLRIKMIFLGIDSGTQSTKTVAVDGESGDLLARAQAAYGLIDGLPAGHLEQDPQDWDAAMDETVGSCLEQLGARREEVQAIGVSGQQHGLVVLDEAGAVIRPAKLWCDTSTAAQCKEYEAAFGGVEGLIRLAGNAILPGYTAPKILWLKQNEPEHFARVRSVLLPHDFLNFRLTGVQRMEYGDASGTGLLDVRRREWCGALLSFTDPRLPELLPPLGDSRQAHGTLKPELAARWGLRDDVLVSAGGGDNMMGAIGTGNVAPGVFTVSLGTSGTVYAAAGEPVIDPKGEVAAFCDCTGQWLPLVCTMNVTVLTEKVRALFDWDLDGFEAQAESASPGAGGLLFLPYLNGERTPNLPESCAVLHGMRSDNLTPGNLARAALEGVTLGLAYGIQRFRDLGVSPSEIRLTGGGSNSRLWRQVAADAFGAETVCLRTAEGAALGAALQAAACWSGGGSFDAKGMRDWTKRWVELDESTRCAPQGDRRDAYAELRSKQMKLTSDLHAAHWI
ncbi:MAG TPA: xylulokinase [Verrucomicrobiales bacterium]|nr:xylulokinase [Verrucomicrobiales bacterium]